jgi:hypothetical protein
MARKKKEKRTEGTVSPPHEASVHVHVSGDSMEEVHEKIARLSGRHGGRGKRKEKRAPKRGSHRE